MSKTVRARSIPYLRDGVPGLTMAEQEAALRAAGADLAAAYRDKLTKMQIKRRTSDSLSQRAKMLHAPPSRAVETIYVANLQALGWTMADISRSLAAAGRRNACVMRWIGAEPSPDPRSTPSCSRRLLIPRKRCVAGRQRPVGARGLWPPPLPEKRSDARRSHRPYPMVQAAGGNQRCRDLRFGWDVSAGATLSSWLPRRRAGQSQAFE